jgi:hypothetical protein
MKSHKAIPSSMSQILSVLLMTLMTLPALAASAEGEMLRQPVMKLAQLSPDERRELRERWEQASPEERIRLRRFFLERMRQLPSPPMPAEVREAMPIPFMARPPRDSRRPPREDRRDDDTDAPAASFGFGFENRHPDADRSDVQKPDSQRFERDWRR